MVRFVTPISAAIASAVLSEFSISNLKTAFSVLFKPTFKPTFLLLNSNTLLSKGYLTLYIIIRNFKDFLAIFFNNSWNTVTGMFRQPHIQKDLQNCNCKKCRTGCVLVHTLLPSVYIYQIFLWLISCLLYTSPSPRD